MKMAVNLPFPHIPHEHVTTEKSGEYVVKLSGEWNEWLCALNHNTYLHCLFLEHSFGTW